MPSAAADTAVGKEKRSAATRIVELVRNAVAELFHDAEGNAFAVIRARKSRQTWPLRGKVFHAWTRRLYYEAEGGRTAGSQAVEDALATLEGQALFEGAERAVHVRVAENDGSFYLDLADDAWQTVQLRPGGWDLTSDPPVHFRRPRGLLALPTPERGGRLGDLWRYVNVADDGDWRLIVAWLMFAVLPRGPFPVLILSGRQGSGKSTKARIFRELIDPNLAPLRSGPREPRDLAIMASNAWVVVLDNLSQLSEWLSDALCQLATGGGFSTRELYSDGEEALFCYKRPIILTSIEDVATRGDLLERALVVTLPSIPEADRWTEEELLAEFRRDRAALLGALLSAVAATLKELPHVRPEALLRMADFTRFGIAAEKALDSSAAQRTSSPSLTSSPTW